MSQSITFSLSACQSVNSSVSESVCRVSASQTVRQSVSHNHSIRQSARFQPSICHSDTVSCRKTKIYRCLILELPPPCGTGAFNRLMTRSLLCRCSADEGAASDLQPALSKTWCFPTFYGHEHVFRQHTVKPQLTLCDSDRWLDILVPKAYVWSLSFCQRIRLEQMKWNLALLAHWQLWCHLSNKFNLQNEKRTMRGAKVSRLIWSRGPGVGQGPQMQNISKHKVFVCMFFSMPCATHVFDCYWCFCMLFVRIYNISCNIGSYDPQYWKTYTFKL